MKRIHEPRFHKSPVGGERDYVLPGNKEFVQGDTLPRPQGGGDGGGSEASDSGEGQDDFQFTLTREEFLDALFDELALPNLAKTHLKEAVAFRTTRTGFSSTGTPSNINLVRTMRKSLARRIALHRPRPEEMQAIEFAIGALEDAQPRCPDQDRQLIELRERRDLLLRRVKRIAYVDPVDLRYNRFAPTPKPNAQAVMFCLMDVSGSMTEDRKDLAKRFFLLLHLFLTRKYDTVDLVFIRHTTEAQEVDEETFFRSQETGGTIVSSALAEMKRIVAERYPLDEWNIYAAQASDGDNFSADGNDCRALLTADLLPICQYFAYIEVLDERESSLFRSDLNVSELWRDYQQVAAEFANFAMKRVFSKADIFPVFHELFHKTRQAA